MYLTPEEIALIAAAVGMPKLLVKLLDAIQKGVGTATEPYYVRKRGEAEADAEAYRINKLAETFLENQKRLPEISFKDGKLVIPESKECFVGSLKERTERRIAFLE